MRSKTTTGIKTHFQRRKKPREAERFTPAGPREAERFTRAFGLGILAKRLRWRPERNPLKARALTKKTPCFKI
jgi:hypothetical protein